MNRERKYKTQKFDTEGACGKFKAVMIVYSTKNENRTAQHYTRPEDVASVRIGIV